MTLVTYKSKYGHTQKYATWIAQQLNADLKPLSDVKKKDVSKDDIIIFGTGVYMGKMNGLTKAFKVFNHQPMIVFACGGHLNKPEEIEKLKIKNSLEPDSFKGKFFYVPGGLDFSQVKGIMKPILRIVEKMLKNKVDKTEEEIEMLEGFTNPTYYVDEIYIKEIVDYVKALKTSI